MIRDGINNIGKSKSNLSPSLFLELDIVRISLALHGEFALEVSEHHGSVLALLDGVTDLAINDLLVCLALVRGTTLLLLREKINKI